MPNFSKSDPTAERKLHLETHYLSLVDTSKWRWFRARSFQEELLRASDYELPLDVRLDALESCKIFMENSEEELKIYNRR